MELLEIHLELADCPDHALREQGGPVRVEQAIQGAPDPVIVQAGPLVGRQPQLGRLQ